MSPGSSARTPVGGVALDVDGVLLDVAQSYRRAIVESLEHVYGETVPRSAIQRFKNAGGFNDDWELTYAAGLYLLARRERLEMDVETFTAGIERGEGGLAGAEAVVSGELSGGALERVRAAWDTDRLRAIFQQLYLGAELYESLEGVAPTALPAHDGFIQDEPTLIAQATIEQLTTSYEVGVVTGRPAAEARIALSRVGLSLPDERVFTMDSPLPGKPDPSQLVALAERLAVDSVVFVGDTLDDIETAQRAGEVDDRRYTSAGVLTGGLTGSQGRARFEREGADIVLGDIDELPGRLSPG